MTNWYVYLKLNENRLVINNSKINDNNYHQLMYSHGMNSALGLNNCKIFCLGYLYGNKEKRMIINDLQEFQ